MKFYLPKTLTTLRKFGRSRFSGKDFLHLIHVCNIELVMSSDVEKGSYYYCGITKKHVIELSTKITRAEREQVGWHEFAHYLQNFYAPAEVNAGYCKDRHRNRDRTRIERFADLFAFVCVTGVPMCGRLDFLETLMMEDWS